MTEHDDRPEATADPDPEPRRVPDPPATRRARHLLAGILIALFAAMFLAKILESSGQAQTALFYVGIPAAIALTVTLTARPRSAVGVALATTTIGLALAGPLLNEGIVCLVIAAPLLYGVAALIGLAVSTVRQSASRNRAAVLAVPLLAILVTEGVAGISYLPRENSAAASVHTQAPPSSYTTALAAAPRYDEPDAFLLRTIPFPRPVSAVGTGLDVGDERAVTFTDSSGLAPGARTVPHAMTLRVSESRTSDDGGRVLFDVVDDTTLAKWMNLRAAEVEWTRSDDGGTAVTWTLHWTRTFDPSWYFGPVQQHFTGLAAGYLAETFAKAAQDTWDLTGAASVDGPDRFTDIHGPGERA